MSSNQKAGYWIAVFIGVVIACAIPKPAALFWFWLFPLGLYGPFVPPDWHPPEVVPVLVMLFGWLVYAALSLWFFLARRRALYLTAYVVLVALLILNVVGCHIEWSQMKNGR